MKTTGLTMKKIYKWLVILTFILWTNLSAQIASVTWPLTSTQNPNTPIGNVQASPQIIGAGSASPFMTIFSITPYTNTGQRLITGFQGPGWPAGPVDYTRYIQFDVSPTSGNNFNIQGISFIYGDNPLSTNFNLLKSEVWYSTDGWNSKTQLSNAPLNYLNTTMQTFSKSINIQVASSQTFSLRIFLYTPNGSLAMTPTLAIHNNIIIEGTTSPGTKAPFCTDFEGAALGGWQVSNTSMSVQQEGNNHYIQTTDQSGASSFFNVSKEYTGNWTELLTSGCGSLCFDVNFLYAGNQYNGVTPPQTFTPFIAIEGNGFKARFITLNTITAGDGWHSYCAPLGLLNQNGTLPSNSDGYWIMTTGTSSDWNTLLSNVTKVVLPVDPTSYQNEKFGFDNICLKNTGDCNPPLRFGSICGIKIHDKNGDGVKDANEDGIANWPITLTIGTTTYNTVTDSNGNYCFTDLPAGTYTVSEANLPNWRQIYPAAPGNHIIVLTAGQNVTNVNFSNVEDVTVQLGSICGTKFNDANGNGKQDPGEAGLPNWTFQLTGAANLTTTTDIRGNFCFTRLLPGDYIISEVIQDGWQPTTPNSTGTFSVTLLPGQNLADINFGNKEKLGSICGIKFNDLNGNGIKDAGEPGLSNWVINLTGTINLTATTDDKGNYCFTNLKRGKYTLAEVNKNGWVQTAPSTFTYSFELNAGQSLTNFDFGNKEDPKLQLGSICGIKFNDKNGNGKQDPDELGIAGWQINLGGPIDMTVTTDREGKFCFENLVPGEYKLGEEARNGWRQIVPSTNFYIVQLSSGQTITGIIFGNKEDNTFQLGSICGIKFNDKNGNGVQDAGELGIANWTIKLTGTINVTAVTDENGNYCFTKLVPGKYIVSEENKTGWRQTTPSSLSFSFDLGTGENFKGINFGNIVDKTVQLGSICGMKFNDLNGNGKKDEGEPGLPNWTINLTGPMNLTTTTDRSGNYCFTNLVFGNYTVSEVYKPGWQQTAPTSGSYSIELTEDRNPDDIIFGNKVDATVILGSICGIKFNDKNGNGVQDSGELGIPDWQINLGGPVDLSIKTDKEGKYCFDNLKPGEYVIKEEMQLNWKQTFPASGSYKITLKAGELLKDYNFGNKYEPQGGCVNPPSGMVAWWSFDAFARSKWPDFAGFNNYATLINGPTPIAAKVLGGLQFDGVDDYVEVADHSEINFGTGNFSFDAWIKTTSASGVSPLVDKRDSLSGKGYVFFLQNGNLSLQLADASLETNYVSSLFVADGNWHHIAISVERTNKNGIIFYLDGVAAPLGDPTLHTGSLNNNHSLRIGREFGLFASIFKGALDEIELFNRVITQSEIVSIFNAGSSGKCKPSGTLSSVFGHVFYDLNGNGVIDPKENGLSNWTVLLNGTIISTTVTDANGNFNFTDLKPGNYNVSVAGQTGWSHTIPNKGNYSFDLTGDFSLEQLHFGFTNDPCLSGIKTWQTLGTGFNNVVYALAAAGTNIYAGGTFTSADGVTANHIAKWNGTNWSEVGGGVNGNVNALLVVGNDLYVAGSFTMAGSVNARNIAKWNGTNWSALGDGTNGNISALAVIGTDLYVGGLFTTAGGVNAKNIARWNGSSWSALGGGVINNGSYGVLAFTSIGTDLYVGGGFWGTGGANGANNIIKWNTSNSTWSPLSTGLNDRVYALAVLNGELYAGGEFSFMSGLNTINHIAKWNGTSWTSLGNGTTGGVSGGNWAIAALGTNLYAGGNFATAGTTPANGIAKWDGTDWFELSSGVGGFYYRTVMAITMIGSDIYIGGAFTTAGNVNANYIAKYSCSSTTTSVEDRTNNILPTEFMLDQNYPNPFNPTSTIRYNIPKASFVKISVYDILGREIRVLVNETKSPGAYEVTFDAKNLASGVYIYSIKTENYFLSRKMVLMK